MRSEVLVVLAVVLADHGPTGADPRRQILDLRGRELPGVPGSWVSQVAIHPYPRAEVGSLHQADPPADDSTDDERDHELNLDYGVGVDDD